MRSGQASPLGPTSSNIIANQPTIPAFPTRNTQWWSTPASSVLIRNRLFRVSTNELRPLPLMANALPSGVIDRNQASLIKEVALKILGQHGIQAPVTFDDLGGLPDFISGGWDTPGKENTAAHVRIVNRHPPGYSTTIHATLLIEADWNTSDSGVTSRRWISAVSKIHSALIALEGPMPSLDVEMISTHLTRVIYVYPIQDDAEFERKWNGHILDGVTNLLQTLRATKDRVNAVTISRFGPYRHPLKNPITIYVAVSNESDETQWTDVEHALQSYLRPFPRDIRVWIEHNDLVSSVFDLTPPYKQQDAQHGDAYPYATKVNLGDAIGPSAYTSSSGGQRFSPGFGTLGCYLQVKQSGVWLTLGLTNYRIVRPFLEGFVIDVSSSSPKPAAVPRHGTALWKADRDGIQFQQARTLLMECPPRHKHMRVMANLDDHIKQLQQEKSPSKELQLQLEERREKQQFFDEAKHKMGNLWAASGFSRRSGGHRMDWALFQPPGDGVGSNSLPDRAARVKAHRTAKPGDADKHRQLCNHSSRVTLATAETGTKMFKMGAKSGPTAGLYSGFKGCIGIPESKYIDRTKTDEHVFLPCVLGSGSREAQMGVPGDSGAVIYNNEGVAVGLLFRGLGPQQALDHEAPWTFVTPIEDVLADIKAFTGVEDIRIPGGD